MSKQTTKSKALTPVQEIKGTLDKMAPSFKSALPKHISVDKFIRVAQTAILNNKDLVDADRRSLMAACVRSAEAGLMPNGSEAALVTFKGQVVFMPMIAGLLKLVRNSGELQTITANVVYENDDFDYSVDHNGESLTHKPNIFTERGGILGAYALAKTKDGGVYIELLSNADILSIEKCSRGNNTPWKGPFRNEMIKKSALRRLIKKLPISTDIEMVIKADDELYDFNEPADEPIVSSPSKPSKLLDALGDDDDPSSEREVSPQGESIPI